MRNKIFYEIEESNFYFVYNNLKFYFSSEFYLNNFKKKVFLYIIEESRKIKSKYNMYIDMDLYFALFYYKQIEKRGFYVEILNKETGIYENLLSKEFCFRSYIERGGL